MSSKEKTLMRRAVIVVARVAEACLSLQKVNP